MKNFAGLVSVAECGERKDGPDRCMGILATVFADAGEVPFDVARVRVRAVEWRSAEEAKAIVATHEGVLDRRHGARSSSRFSGTRNDPSGLGNRIGAAFCVRGGAERRPIVKAGTPMPIAISRLSFKRLLGQVGGSLRRDPEAFRLENRPQGHFKLRVL